MPLCATTRHTKRTCLPPQSRTVVVRPEGRRRQVGMQLSCNFLLRKYGTDRFRLVSRPRFQHRAVVAVGYTWSASCAPVWSKTLAVLSKAEPDQRWRLHHISEKFVSLPWPPLWGGGIATALQILRNTHRILAQDVIRRWFRYTAALRRAASRNHNEERAVLTFDRLSCLSCAVTVITAAHRLRRQ